jgi:hypothetical protein
LIKTLFDGEDAAGQQRHIVQLPKVASGLYFIKISSGDSKISQKLISIN